MQGQWWCGTGTSIWGKRPSLQLGLKTKQTDKQTDRHDTNSYHTVLRAHWTLNWEKPLIVQGVYELTVVWLQCFMSLHSLRVSFPSLAAPFERSPQGQRQAGESITAAAPIQHFLLQERLRSVHVRREVHHFVEACTGFKAQENHSTKCHNNKNNNNKMYQKWSGMSAGLSYDTTCFSFNSHQTEIPHAQWKNDLLQHHNNSIQILSWRTWL